MWFNNLQVFRLTSPWKIDRLSLDTQLSRVQFTPCASNELQSQGWASPRDDGYLSHWVNKQALLSLTTEKKLLPASVVEAVVKLRCADLAEEQGHAPGRKARAEIKERVTEELIPRAFTTKRTTGVWVDNSNGWLVIDAASPARADEVIKALLKCCDKLPLEGLRTATSPGAAMTSWLSTMEAPRGFTLDQDTVLQAPTEDQATVKYASYNLDTADVRKHLGEGKKCTQLAMTWRDKISFVLTETGTIKRVKPLDVLNESRTYGSDEMERFDSDVFTMAGEFNEMLADLVHALGGFQESAEG